MSRRTEPTQLIEKELSEIEYRLFEEWAPETLKGRQAAIHPSTYKEKEVTANKEQNHNHKRVQNRSSSLYEEWKAQALRTDKLNERTYTALSTKDIQIQVSGDGAKSHHKPGEGDTLPAQQRSPKKTAPTGQHIRPSTNTNSRLLLTRHTQSPGKGSSERQQDRKGQHHSKEDYIAPNGCRLSKSELARFSNGVKLKGADKVYFRPSFLEDPWKDFKLAQTTISRASW